MYEIQQSAAGESIFLAIEDTNGQPITNLAHNTAGLAFSYARLDAADTAISPLQALAGPTSNWVSAGFVHVAGGVYRLCLPDAAQAAGSKYLVVRWSGGGSRPGRVLVKLTSYDPYAAGPSATDVASAAATAILTTPANKLATDGTGRVTTANPGGLTGAQDTALTQINTRVDVAVSTRSTLDANAVAAAVLATPANKLATDGTGRVTASNPGASAAAVVTALEADGTKLSAIKTAIDTNLNAPVGSVPAAVVTALKADAEWQRLLAAGAGRYTVTYPNALPGSATVVLYGTDNTTTVATHTITLDAMGRPTGRTVA